MASGPKDFLDCVASRFNGGYLQLAAQLPDAKTMPAKSYRPGDRHAQLTYIERHLDRNIYFSPNELASAKKSKAREKDIDKVLVLQVDLDPTAPETETEEYQANLVALKSFRLPPSLIVSSGRGLQAVWFLSEPIKVNGNLDDIKSYNKRLAQFFGGDGVQNLDRLLRVPGTKWYPNKSKRKKGWTETRDVPSKFEYNDVSYALDQFDFLPAAKRKIGTNERTCISPQENYILEFSPLSEKLREEIRNGDESKFKSRSEWVFSLVRRMRGYRLYDEQIAAICINRDYNISEYFHDKADTLRQIERCLFKTDLNEPALPEFSAIGEQYFEEPQPQQYVVDPLIAAGKPAGLFATGGEGKTTLMLRLAACVASGRFFYDWPTTKGRVVFLNAEEDDDDLRRRFYAIQENLRQEMREQGATEEHEQQFLDAFRRERNLYLISVAGRDLRFIEPKGSSTEFSANLDRLVDAMPDDVALLIIDPMSRFLGFNENDNSACTMMVNAIDYLKNSLGCAVMVLGHTNKEAEKSGKTSTHDARGGSAITDGLRSVWRLKTADAKTCERFAGIDANAIANGDILVLEHKKSNVGPRARPIYLKRNGPDFERLDAHFISELERNETHFETLWSWFSDPQGNDSEPFYKGRVEPTKGRHDGVWGGALSRDGAREVFRWAEEMGYLVQTEARNNAPWIIKRPEGDSL